MDAESGANSGSHGDPWSDRVANGAGAAPPQLERDSAYLQLIASYSVDRIRREPAALRVEHEDIQTRMEVLAIDNYVAFVDAARCTEETTRAVSHMQRTSAQLEQSSIPAMKTEMMRFAEDSRALAQRKRVHATMVKYQVALLELLELPQLMDTCVLHGLHEEALDLFDYGVSVYRRFREHASLSGGSGVATLPGIIPARGRAAALRGSARPATDSANTASRRQGAPAVIRHVLVGLHHSRKKLKGQLLDTLRGALPLAKCLRTVGYLRRIQACRTDAIADGFDKEQRDGERRHGHGHITGSESVKASIRNDLDLRRQFLACREEWIVATLAAIQPSRHRVVSAIIAMEPSKSASPANSSSFSGIAALYCEENAHNNADKHMAVYEYLAKYLDESRIRLFEVVTQYSAIFVDDDEEEEEEEEDNNARSNAQNGKKREHVLTMWVGRRVECLLSELAELLPLLREGGLVANLLEQAMYCGVSFARIGVDFRGLLPDIFENSMLRIFRRSVDRAVGVFARALEVNDLVIDEAMAAKLALEIDENRVPHSKLLLCPPLSLFCNSLIDACNNLRQCAPLALRKPVTQMVSRCLVAVAHMLSEVRMKCLAFLPLNASLTAGTQSSHDSGVRLVSTVAGEIEGSLGNMERGNEIIVLARMARTVLVPFVGNLLNSVFISGHSRLEKVDGAPVSESLLDVEAIHVALAAMCDGADDVDGEVGRTEATATTSAAVAGSARPA